MTIVGTPDRFVRVANEGDAEAIAAVQAAAWAQRFALALPPDELPDSEALAAQWQEGLTGPCDQPLTGLVLVATAGGEVVGVLAAGPTADDDRVEGEVEITELAVAPEFAGDGHGSRLVTAWADLSAPAGVKAGRIWLSDQDVELRGLLGAAGFAPDGARSTLDLRGDGSITVDLARHAVGLA